MISWDLDWFCSDPSRAPFVVLVLAACITGHEGPSTWYDVQCWLCTAPVLSLHPHQGRCWRAVCLAYVSVVCLLRFQPGCTSMDVADLELSFFSLSAVESQLFGFFSKDLSSCKVAVGLKDGHSTMVEGNMQAIERCIS